MPCSLPSRKRGARRRGVCQSPAPALASRPGAAMPECEPIVSRYFTMNVAGDACRIYMEEAGRGLPLVCLHTAGADARQYRHLMCDRAITDHYRVIAFDLPWHGKSNPPVGWRDRDYRWVGLAV